MPDPFPGMFLPVFGQKTASDLAGELEQIIGGIPARVLRKMENSADPMPSAILAMMRLAEFYANTEGDVWQTVEVPLDVAMSRPLEIESPDSGYERELFRLYSEEHLDMHQTLYHIWLCSSIYGQAFPLEIWDDDHVEDSRIILLPPKNVDVGRSFTVGGSLSIRPPDGTKAWNEQLLGAAFPPMVYRRYGNEWNEQAAHGHNLVIPPESCFVVREKSLPFQRYAIPPLARASRSISTRRIYEEMRRATIEGHKNQLWFFRYGDPSGNNLPTPDEMKYLCDQVNGLYGERTGVLVWDGRLSIQVIAPSAPDILMGNETYIGLTMDIFRRLGVSLRVISGERGPLGGGSARVGESELDVTILIERLRFKLNQMYRWESRFRRNLAQRLGPAAVRADQRTMVRFGRITMEVQNDVRERLLPAYQSGVLSARTFLEGGGWSWEAEKARKQEEQQYLELLRPPASFAQIVLPSTDRPATQREVVKEVLQTRSLGRPPDSSNVRKTVEGSAIEDRMYAEYVQRVYDQYDRLVIDARDVNGFTDRLADLNREYMFRLAESSYREHGGVGTLDQAWAQRAVDYVNSFVDGFAGRIRDSLDNEDRLSGALRYNAYLYPQEGRHLAVMYGLQQAMREKGATGWRRVLHPELSETGPCAECAEDASIIHDIDEPFFEFHPNGVCTAQSVAFYGRKVEEGPVAEVPIPHKEFLPERIARLLQSLGIAIEVARERLKDAIKKIRPR